MKDRVTVEQVNALTNYQKKYLVDYWQPVNGDVVTDGECIYVVYKDKVLPLEEGTENAFSKQNYLPLLSIGALYELLEERFGEEALEYGTSEFTNANGYREPYPLNEKSIDYLWDAFVEYASYEGLIHKMADMLIATFAPYVVAGKYDEKLSDDDFIDEGLTKQYGSEYNDLLKERDVLAVSFDEEDFWDMAWNIVDEKISA